MSEHEGDVYVEPGLGRPLRALLDILDLEALAEAVEGLLVRGLHAEEDELESGLALLAIVGRGMRDTRGVAGKVFTALAKKNINIKMIDQGSSELNIIIGVKEKYFEDAIRALYDTFVTEA